MTNVFYARGIRNNPNDVFVTIINHTSKVFTGSVLNIGKNSPVAGFKNAIIELEAMNKSSAVIKRIFSNPCFVIDKTSYNLNKFLETYCAEFKLTLVKTEINKFLTKVKNNTFILTEFPVEKYDKIVQMLDAESIVWSIDEFDDATIKNISDVIGSPFVVKKLSLNHKIDNYKLPEDVQEVLEIMLYPALKAGVNFNMGLVGNAGNGKTMLAKRIPQFIKNYIGQDFSFTMVSCQNVRSSDEFFGKTELVQENGTTVTKFVFTEMFHNLTKGNAVILFNEVNRMPADISNALLDLTDGNGNFTVDGVMHSIGKNLVFIMTYNEGASYTGTFNIDGALLSRFDTVLTIGLPNNKVLMEIGHMLYPNVEKKFSNLFADITVTADNERQKASADIIFETSIRAYLGVMRAVSIWLSTNPESNLENVLGKLFNRAYISKTNHDATKALLASYFNTNCKKLSISSSI